VSARTHPRLVGAFVLAAVALLLAAVVYLTSGGWFQPRDRFAVFFPGSLSGLGPGSPVSFRGVRIGQVTSVTPFQTVNPAEPIQIEVVLELYGDVVEVPEGVVNPYADLSNDELAHVLIERGIRARLVSVSLLTGQRAIDFDFDPDSEARFAGLSRRHPELPTTPTALERLSARFEEFSEKLAELPLDEMLDDVRNAITAVRDILESEDLRDAFAGAKRSAQALEPLLLDTRNAVVDVHDTLKTLDVEATRTSAELRQTLAEARERLERLQRTIDTVDGALQGADDTRIQAARAFDELQRTMKALGNLVEYIQTHPEAVLQGKESAEEEKR